MATLLKLVEGGEKKVKTKISLVRFTFFFVRSTIQVGGRCESLLFSGGLIKKTLPLSEHLRLRVGHSFEIAHNAQPMATALTQPTLGARANADKPDPLNARALELGTPVPVPTEVPAAPHCRPCAVRLVLSAGVRRAGEQPCSDGRAAVRAEAGQG